MKRIYITAIPLDSNFAIAPYAAQAANYQQTYTAPSCYPITPIIADTARPGDEITVLAVRQKNSSAASWTPWARPTRLLT